MNSNHFLADYLETVGKQAYLQNLRKPAHRDCEIDMMIINHYLIDDDRAGQGAQKAPKNHFPAEKNFVLGRVLVALRIWSKRYKDSVLVKEPGSMSYLLCGIILANIY